MQYLRKHDRTGVYKFRRFVPPELRPHLPPPHTGKSEIVISHGTKDPRAVRETHLDLTGQIERIFDQTRRKLCGTVIPDPSPVPPKSSVVRQEPEVLLEEAERVAAIWLKEINETDIDRRIAEGRRDEALADWEKGLADMLLTRVRHKLRHGDFAVDDFIDPADEPHLASIIAEPDSSAGRRFGYSVLRAICEYLEEQLRRIDGQMPPLPPPSVASVKTLQEVFDLYSKERKPKPKTLEEFRNGVDRFLKVSSLTWGTSVTSINRAHVVEFKNFLLGVPAYMDWAKPLAELRTTVAAAASKGRATLTGQSINKNIGGLKAVLEYAVGNGYITVNPAAKVGVEDTEPKYPRVPFSAADLAMIFTSDLFRNPVWGADQWLAVLGPLTGCRLEELGQLKLSDIKTDHGVTYINVTDLPDPDDPDDQEILKSVKTRSSRRRIPIHPLLIKIGFLRYVDEQRRRAQGPMLFPDLPAGENGKRTAAYSKKFSRLIRGLGITYRGKVFHSFRHLFKEMCRDAAIPEEIHDTLTGHASASIGRKYGGNGLLRLAECMGRVRVEGIPEEFSAPV
jgi:integrase